MFVYYQTAEDSKQSWILCPADQYRQKRDEAYHESVYVLDKDPERVDPEKQMYKGDLWFDIDHKPTDHTPEAKNKAIYDAIIDVRRLLSYFESIDLDPKFLRIYATGGKGFHVCVPGKLFDADRKRKNLPKIHKHMAAVIAERAAMTGLDMQMYAMGKGHLIRVENRLRSNGKYKRLVSYEDVKVMTPEMYADLTSKVEAVTQHEPSGYCRELAILFDEGADIVDSYSKSTFVTVESEQLACFNDEEHPPCVQKIVANEGMADRVGKFNGAKMSLARYLVHAPLTDAGKESLLRDFSDNWTSDRHRSAEDRRKAVKEILGIVKDQGFSCSLMTIGLLESPCNNCQLHQQVLEQAALEESVEETPFMYRRMVARGEGPRLTNFALVPVEVHYPYDGGGSFTHIQFIGKVAGYEGQGKAVDYGKPLLFETSVWQSASKMKSALTNYSTLSYFGNDVDLQQLKAYLERKTMMGIRNGTVRVVRYTKTVGINKYQDAEKGIDEYVWVEDHWSINAQGVVNTLRHHALVQNGSRLCWPLQFAKPYHGSMEAETQTLHKMFYANNTQVLGTVLGWMMSCWLRNHLRHGEDNNKHLPALQIYGSSGHGKTATASVFAALAGADYCNATSPLVVSASTPYTIQLEGACSTTVPRIFDEMNEFKISERNKYSTAREVIKASANAGAMKRGMIGTGGAEVDERTATAPIIMLATQLNPEKEIVERTVGVSINRNTRTSAHTENFVHVRSNVKHLVSFAKRAMICTLNLDHDWVANSLLRCQEMLPAGLRQGDRVSRNWEVTALGLEFMRHVLMQAEAPMQLLEDLETLRLNWFEWLRQHAKEIAADTQVQEVDMIINTFGEMIAVDRSAGAHRHFKHGENYLRQGNTLYIYVATFFPKYLQHCRQVLSRPPELSTITQFRDLLDHQPYFIQGVYAPAGAVGGKGWNAFLIPELEKRGVNIDNFIAD